MLIYITERIEIPEFMASARKIVTWNHRETQITNNEPYLFFLEIVTIDGWVLNETNIYLYSYELITICNVINIVNYDIN